jgi:predicted nucleotidyltransferase
MDLDKAKLVEALKGVKCTEVILYGSYAYGTPGPESDLDILLVTDVGLAKGQEDEIERKLEEASGVKVDMWVYSPWRMAEEAPHSTMIPDAVTKGVVLLPEGREHSLYMDLAKEWSAEATALFHLKMANRFLNLMHHDWLDEDQEKDAALRAEMREWGSVMAQSRAASAVRNALWALLWSAEPTFSKQQVAGLSGGGKWAHWSAPSLLKALERLSPESHEHIQAAADALLAKPLWRELFNDTKAAGSRSDPLVPQAETKELVAKVKEMVDLIGLEVDANLVKQAHEKDGPEASLA